MNSALDVLRAARAKLEQGWCQRMSGQDPGGAPVMYFDPEATAWCLAGALAACCTEGDDAATQTLGIWAAQMHPALQALGFACIGDAIDWNDAAARTRPEVLLRLDTAIQSLQPSQFAEDWIYDIERAS